ncbi:MAG: aminotransferase class I/II-fold pyridoxal phosphate-dependent enzyme, partial [Synergistaceae bacterium]|nr:aminotransferase class I/II-fold pyridoxal phosphate-dependent enzyme [Synergistaceae bacterium]
VVIDEAYGEFAQLTWLSSSAGNEIPPNALILKTLSKAWGAAGIRLGYALCGPDILEGLAGAKGPFNVNILTQAAGHVLLDHPERALETISLLRRVRDNFYTSIQGLPGWKIFPGEANFLLLRAPFSKDDILRKSEGKFVFKFLSIESPEGDFSWIRMTIGTEENMEDVLSFFRSLEEHP